MAARQSGTARKTSSKTANAKSRTTSTASPGADTYIAWYRDMLLIRRFEEKAGQLYGLGLIAGFCHL